MKSVRTIIILVILAFFCTAVSGQEKAVTKKEYLEFAKATVDKFWKSYDADIKRWADRIDLKNIWGYRPPGGPINLAYTSAYLYKITGKKKYADIARKCLVEYGDFKKYYPDNFWNERPGYEDGLPPLPDFFMVPKYVEAYGILKDTKVLSKKDKEVITDIIARSCNTQMRNFEWGAMNRGMLRAESFYLASKYIPEHPDAKKWRMMAQITIDDCWGTWEIEDAQGYVGIYLYSLVSLAERYKDKEYWNLAVTRYTMQYYAHLLNPYGMIPAFGDGYLNCHWHRLIPVFEKAAAMYKDPELKYAANRIHDHRWNLKEESRSTWYGVIAIDCYRWADDKIVPKAPPGKSETVMEDGIGKKVVFRDGYGEKATYMMVNYKDEGDIGFLSRDYLRKTIPVEEEKMTHGHADENDIGMLMTDGCVLLHDGGYRDYMPSGVFGAFRADYFHNRVVVRKDKIFKGQKDGEFRYAVKDYAAVPGQKVIDFVRNSGAYREVETELIDFLSTKDFDYSRTRVADDKLGYEHDRIVTWVKPLNIFVVFDAVKYNVSDYYTAVNFWHTRKVLAKGENYYDTQYDKLRRNEFPTHKSLLIYFPEGTNNGRMIGDDPEKRYWQDETAIHQAMSRWHFAGDMATFTTVLVPHDTGSDLDEIMKNIETVKIDKYPKAAGVKITDGGKTYYVCSKLDMMMDINHKDYRPMYDYDNGRVKYDDFETDALQFFAVLENNTVDFASVYSIKLTYRNQDLFAVKPVLFGLNFDATPDRLGYGKLRCWKDKVEIK